jgi:hypothetical protein
MDPAEAAAIVSFLVLFVTGGGILWWKCVRKRQALRPSVDIHGSFVRITGKRLLFWTSTDSALTSVHAWETGTTPDEARRLYTVNGGSAGRSEGGR